MERDVVCGMQVDPAKAAATSDYNGKTYYFCAKGCKTKFDANPGAVCEVTTNPRAGQELSRPSGARVTATTHESARTGSGRSRLRHDDRSRPTPSVIQTYKGTTYYFCSESCLERFGPIPTSFLDPPDGGTSLGRRPRGRD